MPKRTATTSSPARGGLDPAALGNPVRAALAFESVITIAFGIYFVAFSKHYLATFMCAPAAELSTAAIQTFQWFGACNLYFGLFLGFWVPNTKANVQSRSSLYRWTLGFEALWVVQMAWQALSSEEAGFPSIGLWGLTAQVAAFMVWRSFVLFVKPEWCGRWLEVERKTS